MSVFVMKSVTHIARKRQTITKLRTNSEHLYYRREITCDKVTASVWMFQHSTKLLREKRRDLL